MTRASKASDSDPPRDRATPRKVVHELSKTSIERKLKRRVPFIINGI
jgi:hypothetical protein